MGSAKSVTHAGIVVAVIVGRGEGVTEGWGVLLAVGFNVSVGLTGVSVGVSCDKNAPHPIKIEENNIAIITR
jgi:hypothetical protein